MLRFTVRLFNATYPLGVEKLPGIDIEVIMQATDLFYGEYTSDAVGTAFITPAIPSS